MPCSVSIFVSSPPEGSSQPLRCALGGTTGILSYANGGATTDCKVRAVRATLNGVAAACSFSSTPRPGGGYVVNWYAFDLQGGNCGGANNQLVITVDCEDAGGVVTSHDSPIRNFFGVCGVSGMPPRTASSSTFELQLGTLVVSSVAWGLTASHLVETRTIKLKRVKPKMGSEISAIEWQFEGDDKSSWLLRATGRKDAELILRLPIKVDRERTYLEQRWSCAKFSIRKGGTFTPFENIIIPECLVVSAPSARKRSAKSTARKARGKKRARR